MKKILFVLCLFLFSMIVNAQDVVQMKYGDVLKGTMKKSSTEVEFSFEGEVGDIVVIEVSIDNEDILNGLSPELELLNGRGTRLVKTSDINDGLENYDGFSSKIVLEIPASETYTVLVTNAEMFTLQNDAPFTIRLIKPSILETEALINGTVDSDFPAYFVVISASAFSIRYNVKDGQFRPAVTVGRIQDGKTELLATMYGSHLLAGSLSVETNRNKLHLITVARSASDLEGLFSKSDAEFTIEMSTNS